MDKLGIEPTQLLMQVVNFTIIAVVLTKFLYKPILKILDERKKKIEDGLRYTEQVKAELEKTEKKRKEILAEAREEANSILEEAKVIGRKLEGEIIQKAQQEAASLLEKGRADIALEQQELERQVKEQSIEVAATMSESVLRGLLDGKAQRRIIDKKIADIAKVRK